jgi:hypothetical protein
LKARQAHNIIKKKKKNAKKKLSQPNNIGNGSVPMPSRVLPKQPEFTGMYQAPPPTQQLMPGGYQSPNPFGNLVNTSYQNFLLNYYPPATSPFPPHQAPYFFPPPPNNTAPYSLPAYLQNQNQPPQ